MDAPAALAPPRFIAAMEVAFVFLLCATTVVLGWHWFTTALLERAVAAKVLSGALRVTILPNSLDASVSVLFPLRNCCDGSATPLVAASATDEGALLELALWSTRWKSVFSAGSVGRAPPGRESDVGAVVTAMDGAFMRGESMHFGDQPCAPQVRFLSWILFWVPRTIDRCARCLRDVAGAKQLSKEEFIERGLLAAGRFNLELAQSVVAQGADGLPLTTGLEIRGAQF